MTELQLATTEKFGNIQTNIYQDENNEMYMTIAQLAECLGYTGKSSIKSLISRNPYLRNMEFSREVALCNPLDNSKFGQLTRVFNEDGIYEVTFLSNTPKALEFHRWVRQLLKSLRKGELQLSSGNVTFAKEIIEAAIQKYLPVANTKALNIWKYQTVKPLVDKISTSFDIDTRTAYDTIYDYMTEHYGFTKSFAITHFCDKYRLDNASVIDAIADDYTLQGWFVQSANSLIGQNGIIINTPAVSTVLTKFNLSDNVSDVVKAVADKYNDHTMNYCHTYGKIYSAMNTKQGWKNLRTRYHCIINKDVIEANIKCKKKFIAVANNLV